VLSINAFNGFICVLLSTELLLGNTNTGFSSTGFSSLDFSDLGSICFDCIRLLSLGINCSIISDGTGLPFNIIGVGSSRAGDLLLALPLLFPTGLSVGLFAKLFAELLSLFIKHIVIYVFY
jgi:hypothetical protein